MESRISCRPQKSAGGKTQTRILLNALLIVALSGGLAACASKDRKDDVPAESRSQEELRAEADQLYRSARTKLESSDFSGALTDYNTLRARYPFSDYATQAQLESIFAAYRAFQPEQALAEADRFLREHPRHPQIAYLLYLRGMINFTRNQSIFDNSAVVDTTKRDVGAARRAFDDFSSLVGRFPDSPYAADARQRMIYLRNRIAAHEIHVVNYYMKREAYLAAARRAEAIVATYPGAPASLDALELLAASYAELGLREQAEQARRLIEVTEPERAARVQLEPSRPWWRWLWPFGGAVDTQAAELPPA
jgi:outer membrane protein assembly factor BamD